MSRAAESAGLDPNRLSFTTTLRLVCRTVINQDTAAARTLANTKPRTSINVAYAITVIDAAGP